MASESERAQARAYQRARRRLQVQHQAEFKVLLEQEKAREGIRTLTPRQVIEEAREEAMSG